MRNRAWLIWGFLIAGAASLSAQEPALPGSFGESIDVRVVNVEAVVTDSHGNRVRGLTAGDFRLKVDGKQVPIEFFAEMESGKPAAPLAEAKPDEPAAPVPAAPTGDAGRSILILVDDAFTLAVHRNAVLQGVKRDLAGLRPQDQMAIVAVGLDYQPTVLTRWSSDRTVLSAALDAACNRPAGGIDVMATRRSLRADEDLIKAAAEANDLYLDNDASHAAVAEGPPTGVDARLYSQLLKLPTVLVATLHGMAPASGRRVLLLVSGGWPVPRVLTPLVVAANRLGYTAYPVDAHGSDTAFAVNDATQTGPSADTALVTSAWQRAVDSGMEFLARMTGGKAFVNSARLDSLARLAEDTNTYYWLGFTPAWKGDDHHHRIEVETVRKDLSVRSRHGFSDLSRASETAVSATGSMLLGGGDPKARKVRIETGQAEGRGKTIKLPVTVAIPVGDLTAIEQAGYWTYQLILSVGVVDSHGGYSNVAEIPLHLTLPQKPAAGGLTRYRTVLELRRGEQRLVMTVRDPLAGTVVWGDAQVKP
jgi:VWFA-related protein